MAHLFSLRTSLIVQAASQSILERERQREAEEAGRTREERRRLIQEEEARQAEEKARYMLSYGEKKQNKIFAIFIRFHDIACRSTIGDTGDDIAVFGTFFYFRCSDIR